LHLRPWCFQKDLKDPNLEVGLRFDMYTTMLLPIVLLLTAAASNSTVPSEGTIRIPTAMALALTHEPDDRPETSPWDGSGRQFAAGFVGGALGSAGGAVVGGLAGAMLGMMIYGSEEDKNVQDEELFYNTPQWAGLALFGGAIGTLSGGMYCTGWLVEKSSSREYPTRGKGPAIMGSFVGLIGGVALIASVPAITDNPGGFWTGYATLLACSSLGAVFLDRSAAVPAQVSVGPWLPRPGFAGMRVGLAF